MLDQAERAAIAGDLASADELLRSAARIQEAELGPLHPDLVSTLNNLGIVAEKTGRPGDAEAFYRRAAATASASLPSDHPIVAESRKTLEDFCRERGLPIDAAVVTRRAIASPLLRHPVVRSAHNAPQPLPRTLVALACMGGDRCRRPGDYRVPCEASLVAARNVNADTDVSIHGAAGRRASAAASRHARSDRTGTTAEGRTAWRQSRRRHRHATSGGSFSGGHQSSHCPTVPDLFDERRQLAMRSGRRLGVTGADRPLHTCQIPARDRGRASLVSRKDTAAVREADDSCQHDGGISHVQPADC